MHNANQQVGAMQRPELRDARPEDAALLAEFGARTFYETFAAENSDDDMHAHLASSFTPARQLCEIEDPERDTLILAIGVQWVGFAQLRIGHVSEGVPKDDSIELWRFYIDRPWHGCGMAALLMDGAKQRARRRGATSIWLGVWEKNARAQAFYRKHGFGRVGKQTFVVGSDPQTDDVMLCRLS
jgi:ribosomal protein S18 acetylase RimI-like enzyme